MGQCSAEATYIALELLASRRSIENQCMQVDAVIGGTATGMDRRIEGALNEARTSIDRAIAALQQVHD